MSSILAYEFDTDPGPIGRRPTLAFQQRVKVGVLWRETYDGLARRGRSTEDPRLAPILKRIAKMRAKNAAPWRIAELSRKADQIGRHSSVPILPPKEKRPEIDRLVAEKTGLTARMVRTIRADPRIIALVGLPVWVPREWQREGKQQFEFRRRVLALVTPERFAKGDIALVNGQLVARGIAEPGVIPGSGPCHRVGCEEFRIGLHQPSNELWDIPRAKFIPARRWLHQWPGAVAGWARTSPTWTPELGLRGDPRLPAKAPKRAAGALLSLGYRTRCPTFAHALPDTIVAGPHSTWPWMKVARPLWTPEAINRNENRLIAALDLMGEALEPMLVRLVHVGVSVKKPGSRPNVI
jgi:hypothetical protein